MKASRKLMLRDSLLAHDLTRKPASTFLDHATNRRLSDALPWRVCAERWSARAWRGDRETERLRDDPSRAADSTPAIHRLPASVACRRDPDIRRGSSLAVPHRPRFREQRDSLP